MIVNLFSLWDYYLVVLPRAEQEIMARETKLGEDKLRQLKEEREKTFSELADIIKDIRLTKIRQTEERLLKIFDIMIGNFQSLGENIDNLLERQITLTQRVEALEKEAKRLKENPDASSGRAEQR